MRTRYRFVKGELVEIAEDAPAPSKGAFLHLDLPDHVSPIDGSVLTGRAARRDHMRRHDVVDARELGGGNDRRNRDTRTH